MARLLTTKRQIDAFIKKVIKDANHHAPAVNHVVMPLWQAVRARLNLAQYPLEVIERLGNLGRTCWVAIGGNRYAFSYSKFSQSTELRDNSTQGAVRYQFTNQTTAADIGREVNRM